MRDREIAALYLGSTLSLEAIGDRLDPPLSKQRISQIVKELDLPPRPNIAAPPPLGDLPGRTISRERVYQILNRLRISERQMGLRLGRSTSTFGKWLQREFPPEAAMLLHLLDILNIDLDRLDSIMREAEARDQQTRRG